MRTARHRRAGPAAALSTAALGLTVALAGPAAGDPGPVVPAPGQAQAAAESDAAARVAALDAELAAARAAVDRAAREAAGAAEAYNKARSDLDQRNDEAAAAAAAAHAAHQAVQAATTALSQHAAEVFQGGGGITQLDVFFGASPQSVLDRAAGLDAVQEEQARVLRDADAARQLAVASQQATAEARDRQVTAEKEARQTAASAQARAEQVQAAAEQLRARQEQVSKELAALRRTSAQAERDRQAGLAAAELARSEAENRRRVAAEGALGAGAQAPRAPVASPAAQSSFQRVTPAGASVVGGGVQAVLAFAAAQRGEPYAWGAAGPDSWDCSGLTMMAWAQAGVRLGHYTGTQWAQTRGVPLAEAQPGDLVFYGTSTADIYHVGLYVGEGRMIHAPRTGDVVKTSSIYSMGDLLPFVGRP